MKFSDTAVDSENSSEYGAVFDFLKSHPPDESTIKLILSSWFFSFKSLSDRLQQQLMNSAAIDEALRPSAQSLSTIASSKTLELAAKTLEFKVTEQEELQNIFVERWKFAAWLFCIVLVLSVIYAKTFNYQFIASAVMLATLIVGLPVTAIATVLAIRNNNLEFAMKSYYIRLLKQAQVIAKDT